MNILGQFFHKISGSEEDNQASILGCSDFIFGRRGGEAIEFCYPEGLSENVLVSIPGFTLYLIFYGRTQLTF